MSLTHYLVPTEGNPHVRKGRVFVYLLDGLAVHFVVQHNDGGSFTLTHLASGMSAGRDELPTGETSSGVTALQRIVREKSVAAFLAAIRKSPRLNWVCEVSNV